MPLISLLPPLLLLQSVKHPRLTRYWSSQRFYIWFFLDWCPRYYACVWNVCWCPPFPTVPGSASKRVPVLWGASFSGNGHFLRKCDIFIAFLIREEIETWKMQAIAWRISRVRPWQIIVLTRISSHINLFWNSSWFIWFGVLFLLVVKRKSITQENSLIQRKMTFVIAAKETKGL